MLARKCLDKWRQKCADHISAGIQFSGGVTVDGGVEFSGRNFAGEENIYKWSDIVSVAACNEIFAGLKKDGTVSIAKRKQNYNYTVDTSQWSDIVQISVGEQLIVGLKADGTLLCQGIDEELNKAATNGSNGWSGIVEIDTGWQHIVGLDQNGNIHIAGYNKDYLQNKMNEKKEEWENADIIAIATGGSIGSGKHGRGHIVALKSDGHVIAAGDNEFGQCEVSEWKDIVAIAAGDYHTVGLKSDGTVVTTQKIDFRHNGIDFRDSSIEIAKWKNIVEISAGYGYTLALQDNGEVVSAGNKNEHQRDVDGWNILQSVDVN